LVETVIVSAFYLDFNPLCEHYKYIKQSNGAQPTISSVGVSKTFCKKGRFGFKKGGNMVK